MATSNTTLRLSPEAKQLQADKDLIKRARQLYTDHSSYWMDIYRDAHEDQKYFDGEMQDEQVARAASAEGNRPQISVNQIPSMVQQVENAFRQQNIGITVHATDEQGSEEKAKVLQGMVRHIENISNAKEAYLLAAGSHGAMVPGFGFIKLDKKYCADTSFDMDVVILGVKDPFTIMPDFMAEKSDFSDASFWFEWQVMTKDDYKEKYGESEMASNQYADWGDLRVKIGPSWMSETTCKVAKFWYKETNIRHLAAFENGTVGFLDDLGVELGDDGELRVIDEELATPVMDAHDAQVDDGVQDQFPNAEPTPAKLVGVLKHREVVEEQVKWIITNGMEILERGDWDDSEFPFVGVCGHDIIIDGRRKIFGLVRHVKDSQKMYNYVSSDLIRKIDASNKTPWIAAEDAIREPQRKWWENSHIIPRGVLWYRAYDDQGRPITPPQRGDNYEPQIAQLLQLSMKVNNDIKSSIGIPEAVMGQTPGDRQSGTAIMNLAERGQQTNFHFNDNFVLSIKRLGYLILRLIKHVYDTPRAVRIINPDDSFELVKINQYFNGKMLDMTSDENYDVVIDTGPSFATKKSEQAESMLKFAGLNPQFLPLFADLIAKDMDWDTSEKLYERIQAWQAQIMPFLHATDGMNLPPEAKAAVSALQTKLQQAGQQMQHLGQQNQQLQFEKSAQISSHVAKERQIQIKGMYDLAAKKLELAATLAQGHDQMAVAKAKMEMDHIQHRQQLSLDSLRAQDQATGQTDEALYQRLMDLIQNNGPQGGAPPTQAPSG